MRTPIQVPAGTGAKTFVDYTVSKAIYATGWDDNIILEADAAGHWHKEGIVEQIFVNINTASASELETLPGIGSVKAKAIVDYRGVNGNFLVVADLGKVKGIGPATIDLVKAYVRL